MWRGAGKALKTLKTDFHPMPLLPMYRASDTFLVDLLTLQSALTFSSVKPTSLLSNRTSAALAEMRSSGSTPATYVLSSAF